MRARRASSRARPYALALWKPQFSVRLYLENPAPWELGWLALALRDLDEGLATVGFGVAKGFGRCTIEDPELTFGVLQQSDFPLACAAEDGVEPPVQAAWEQIWSAPETTSGLYRTLAYDPAARADWLVLADNWVQAFCRQLADCPRPSDMPLKADSYFTEQKEGGLPDLYPARVS